MAFKSEEIINEQDVAYFKTFHFVNPVGGKLLSPSVWTINRKENMFLLALGGQGIYGTEIPMFYVIVIERQVIVMETFVRFTGDNFTDKGSDIWLSITKLSIPEGISTPINRIVGCIKAAFVEEWTGENTVGLRRLHFEDIADPRYVPVGYNLGVQMLVG